MCMSASNYSPTFPSVLKSEIIYAKTNLFQTLQQIAKKPSFLKTKILKKIHASQHYMEEIRKRGFLFISVPCRKLKNFLNILVYILLYFNAFSSKYIEYFRMSKSLFNVLNKNSFRICFIIKNLKVIF